MVGLEAVGKEFFPAATAFDKTAFLAHHGLDLVVNAEG